MIKNQDVDRFIRYAQDHDMALDNESAKDKIARILRRDYHFRDKESISKAIINELIGNGTFVFDGFDCFYIENDSDTLIPLIGSDYRCRKLLGRYELNFQDKAFGYTLEALNKLAVGDFSAKAPVRRLSYFREQESTVWVHFKGEGLFRINPRSVLPYSNGAEDIFFDIPSSYERFPDGLRLDSEMVDRFRSEIVQAVNFSNDSGYLDSREQALLFEFWVLSLFFKELMPTRVILTLVGPKGSGKSYALRRLGRLILGPTFNVIPMPGKEDDFDSVITNSELAAFDNADSGASWQEDKLAVAATGGSIARRQLYTTINLARAPITASIALTAHTPKHRRADVVERMLVLHLNRLPSFTTESRMDKSLDVYRRDCIKGLMLLIQDATRALESTLGREETVSFRMADFCSFCRRLAPAWGKEAMVEGIFTKMTRKQQAFVIEGDPLVAILLGMVECDRESSVEMCALDLYSKLASFCYERKIRLESIVANHASLAQKLSTLKGITEGPIRVSSTVRGSRRTLWRVETAGD
jgi:hypothetical protein